MVPRYLVVGRALNRSPWAAGALVPLHSWAAQTDGVRRAPRGFDGLGCAFGVLGEDEHRTLATCARDLGPKRPGSPAHGLDEVLDGRVVHAKDIERRMRLVEEPSN